MSALEDGTRIAAETARRLACDASRVVVSHDPNSFATDANYSVADASRPMADANRSALDANHPVLDVGRKTRTIPSALRRALEVRDRGCRFPGCGLRFTDAHHIVHWADGGETKLDNCLLLCKSHHRRVHEGGYQVCSDKDGQIVFFTPNGEALFEAPPMPELPLDPVEELVRGNRERGITPDTWGAAPLWKRDHDIPWAIEAAAMEALDPSDEPDVGQPDVAEPDAGEPSAVYPAADEQPTD